jgi:hypothetical protein
MHDLARFGLSDVVMCSSELRKSAAGAPSMEHAAQRVVKYLYDNLYDSSAGSRACALVRFFKTHPYSALETQQKQFADRMLGSKTADPAMKCLTLLATTGDEPDWNSRRASRGHAAIPLPSEQIVAQAPMIAQLISQLGLDISTLLKLEPEMITDLAQKSYNVFHVPNAAGSPYIPAQNEFVLPFHIRSVLGFGGMLPSGNLFATIMFAKVAIPRATADLFASVALGVKLAVLPFDGGVTFAPEAAA